MGKSSGSIWVSLGLRTAEFTKGIKKAKGQLNGFQKFGAGLKGMFNPMTIGIGVVAGLGAAIGDAVKTFSDFEKANSELNAVLGEGEKEMKAMSKQAKALGSSTAFTASQVTSLQISLAKLGFNSNEIDNMTESTLAAAAALGSDLGEQATLTGATLKSFGLDSTRAAEVNDVLALSASSSALDFEKLSTALPIVGSVANATGMTLQRTTAILGTLSNNGMDASSSATALRNILIKLSAKGLTWEEAMSKINNSTDKTKTSFDLFGKTSAAAGVILSGQSVKLNELTTALNGADGAAQEMADTMLNNLSGDITIAGSAWEGFILSLEDGKGAMGKAARSMVQGFTSLLTGLKNLDLIWKDTFSGLANFTQDELERTLAGGWETEAGVSIDKIAKHFDKIPIDKIKGNAKEVQDAWVNALGEDVEDAQALFRGYVQQRINDENALIANSKKTTKETKEGIEGVIEPTKQLTKAQQDAALKARNLTLNLSALNDVDLGDFNEKNLDAVGKLKDALQIDQPIKLAIPVIPEIKIDPESEVAGNITGEMVARGEEAGEALSSALSTAAAGGLAGLGEALGGGDISSIGDSLLMGMSGMLASFGQQMIVLGIGMEALKESLALGPLGAGLAIAGGVALIAVATAIKGSLQEKSTGFAQGGLVTGSVFANIGEGIGTTPTNPEVIAPLDKLKSFMNPEGSGGGEVKFRIQGSELVGILKRQNKSNNYSN
jgi:hypothetical protein